MIAIHLASDMAFVRELLLEYAASTGFDLSFQNFDDEISSLPGFYAAIFGPAMLPRVLGLSAPIVSGSNIITPAGVGLIFDRTRDYRAVFVIFIGLILLAAVTSYPLGRNRSLVGFHGQGVIAVGERR